MAHRFLFRLRCNSIRDSLWACFDLCQSIEQGESKMSFSVTEPSQRQKWVAGILVITYAIVTLLPLLWIIATGFKSSSDSIAYPPKITFEPTVEGYVNLFTTQIRINNIEFGRYKSRGVTLV